MNCAPFSVANRESQALPAAAPRACDSSRSAPLAFPSPALHPRDFHPSAAFAAKPFPFPQEAWSHENTTPSVNSPRA